MQKIDTWMARNRLPLTILVWALVLSVFVFIHDMMGNSGAMLIGISVITTGWLWGVKAGLVSGILAYPVILFIDRKFLHGHSSWFDLNVLLASFMASGVSMIFARLNSMRTKVQTELGKRIQAEQQIVLSEHRFRGLFENAPISLWEEDFSAVKAYIDGLIAQGITDFENYFQEHPEEVIHCVTLVRVLDVNETTLKVFGAKDKPQLLRSLDQIFGEESLDVFREELIVIAEGETVFESIGINYDLAGNQLYVDIKWSAAAGCEETLERVFVSVIDITDKVQSEVELQRQKQYLETLIQVSPIAIVTLDMEQKISDCNPAFEKLFGYRREGVLGKILDTLIIPEEEWDVAQQFTTTVEQGDQLHEIVRRKRKDDSLIDVELFALPLIVGGEQVAMLALYHDISDLLEAKRQAEAAATAKAEFLANMSHEIRTPLNAVIGMTGLLMDTPLDPEQRDFASTVRNSGDALLEIINAILDFSKIEAGKLELEQQPFNIREMVESSLDLIVSNASQKGLEIAYIVESEVPATVVGDVTRLRQIMVNLLGNAVKFTEAGEVIARVSSQVREDGLCDLHFSVQDTGIGIPKERIDSLFESFTQVDASTTRRFGGTGLGLAISKQLVEIMGGEMWVESEVGVGSAFHFVIAAPVVVAKTQQIRADDAEKFFRNRRVLIVDDNATNRLILIRQTKSWDMEPHAAASGAEALGWLEEGQTYDLAILDMQMPDMDGAMLTQAIRDYPAGEHLPIILLTSLGGWEVLTNEMQFAARLSKPIKPSMLFDAIAEVMSAQIDDSMVQPHTEEKKSSFDPEMGVNHPLHILLAEDNLINQKVALGILERLGYRADVAGNGLEVLDALSRQHYDVVLMDIQMPEMDGVQATHRICAKYLEEERPRIVAMTAHALDGDRERYIAEGMDDYVSKPVRVDELVHVLRRCPSQSPPKGSNQV